MANGTPNFKVVLTGDYGVGKSSIFRRFIDNSFIERRHPSGDNSSNVGQDYCKRKFSIKGQVMQLELWDTAGLERFCTLSSSYYSKAIATIVCYSLDNEESLSSAAQHILDAMQHTGTAPIFLCGNKVDRKPDNNFRCISSEEIEKFLMQFDGVIVQSYRISCKTGDGVDAMFSDISEYLHRRAVEKYNNSARVFLMPEPDHNAGLRKNGSCC